MKGLFCRLYFMVVPHLSVWSWSCGNVDHIVVVFEHKRVLHLQRIETSLLKLTLTQMDGSQTTPVRPSCVVLMLNVHKLFYCIILMVFTTIKKKGALEKQK